MPDADPPAVVRPPNAAPPARVAELIAQFEQQRAAYRAGTYNESQLRVDFLNPTLGALGWDVHNAAGEIEARGDSVQQGPLHRFAAELRRKRRTETADESFAFDDPWTCFPVVNGTDLLQLPIQRSLLSDEPIRSNNGQLVTLVQHMLDLHKRLPELKSAHDRTITQRQIEATDREIDRLVYELYELTDEEIGIVEGRGG